MLGHYINLIISWSSKKILMNTNIHWVGAVSPLSSRSWQEKNGSVIKKLLISIVKYLG